MPLNKETNQTNKQNKFLEIVAAEGNLFVQLCFFFGSYLVKVRIYIMFVLKHKIYSVFRTNTQKRQLAFGENKLILRETKL